MASGTEGAPPPSGAGAVDARAVLTSKPYRRLLILAGVIGVVVSFVCWAFLEAIHLLQEGVYDDLPDALGLDPVPWWYPLPVLLVAGVLIGLAIARLPGTGGHEPSEGLKTGAPISPAELPGVLLAALASIGLGMVLGPEGPLIAIGAGLTLLMLGLSKKEVPDQATLVLVAASAFAALATIFGSPVIGAIIIIEAAGLGGSTLPVIVLPGLIAAGIGSLVFVGVGSFTGLNTGAYAIGPLDLPAYPEPSLGDIAWTVVLAAVAAVAVFLIVQLGRRTASIVGRRRVVLSVAAALAVAAIAIAFGEITDLGPEAVLFSGQDALEPLLSDADSLTTGVLVLLLACKAVAWAISLGGARGGPTFPAIFLGVTGGLLAANLPGLSESPAVGVLVGAAVVAVLRLPLSAVVIALVLTQGGMAVAPLVIVGVAVAYIVVVSLDRRRELATDPPPSGGR